MTNPVAYLLYILGDRFEALDDERTLQSGNLIIDFRYRPGERIDELLVRWDLVRHEAANVGSGVENWHTLTSILLRAGNVSGGQLVQLLAPNRGRMPTNQMEYDEIVTRLRHMAHIFERSPGNILSGLYDGSDRKRETSDSSD